MGYISFLEISQAEYGKYVRWLENQVHKRSYMWPAIFLGSRISSAVGDILRKVTQDQALRTVEDAKNLWRSQGFTTMSEFGKAGPRGRIDLLLQEIYDQHEILDPLLNAGVMAGLGGTLENYAETFMATGQLHYAYKTLAYHIAITPKMRRYWNYLYAPNWPSFSQAHEYYRRSKLPGLSKMKWTEADVIEAGRMDGWSEGQVKELITSMYATPSPREAFYMWKKGRIGLDERNAYWEARGWPRDLWDTMEDNYAYNPSLYDLTRIADTTGLPQTWTLKKLKRIGMLDEDRARMWEMLKVRPIRDEQRAITTVWTWRYKYGRCTYDELSSALTDLNVSAPEIELLLEKAELDYEDELINEWIEVLTWRFRNAQINEAEFLAGLENLGIRHEKANLMVEQEKAKGYMGGYY